MKRLVNEDTCPFLELLTLRFFKWIKFVIESKWLYERSKEVKVEEKRVPDIPFNRLRLIWHVVTALGNCTRDDISIKPWCVISQCFNAFMFSCHGYFDISMTFSPLPFHSKLCNCFHITLGNKRISDDAISDEESI